MKSRIDIIAARQLRYMDQDRWAAAFAAAVLLIFGASI